jgi:hypothetical protein
VNKRMFRGLRGFQMTCKPGRLAQAKGVVLNKGRHFGNEGHQPYIQKEREMYAATSLVSDTKLLSAFHLRQHPQRIHTRAG